MPSAQVQFDQIRGLSRGIGKCWRCHTRHDHLLCIKAWTDLVNGENDITLLAYTALQVEARRPGTVPRELLEGLSHRIGPDHLNSESLPRLEGDAIEYLEEVDALLEQDSDLGRLVAYQRVYELIDGGAVSPAEIEKARCLIQRDVETFRNLIEKGGENHANVPIVA